MKPDDFDKDLRDLAGGFKLPVQNDLFAQVMQTRKGKRRRTIALYFGGFAAVALSALLLVFVYNKDNSPGVTLNTSQYQNQEVPQQSNKSQPETTQAEKAAHPVQKDPNRAAENKDAAQTTTGFNSSTSGTKQPEKLSLPAQKELKKTVNGQQKIVSKSTEERKLNRTSTSSAIKEQPKQETLIAGTNRLLSDTAEGKPLVKTPATEPVVIQNTLPAPDSSSLLSIDSVAPVFVSGEQLRVQEKTTRRIEAGIYAHYFAITNAVNSSSLVPFNKPDSFGLNEKASYAFSSGIKGAYRFNKTWGIALGIGISKLQFDKIRIAKAKVDSLKWYELTNNGSKDMQSYNQSITEQSFTWLEIPAGISYTIPLNGRISFCTEAGIVYQSLLQSKAYEFTSSGTELSYKEMDNIGHERLNKNIFSVYLQPGLSINIARRLNLFTGLSYRNQLTSYYKKEYFPGGPFYYLGATANFMYKF